MRFGKAKSREEWTSRRVKARPEMLKELDKYCATHPGNGEHVLLCFSCDPYPPQEPCSQFALEGRQSSVPVTRKAIEIIVKAKYVPVILTKGGTRAARDFDLLRESGGWFGQTYGLKGALTDVEERNAAPYADRITAFTIAGNRGIKRWVSVEPMFEAKPARFIIWALATRCIEHFKIGKLNGYDARTRKIEKRINWQQYLRDVRDILTNAGYSEIREAGAFAARTFYIKKELREAR